MKGQLPEAQTVAGYEPVQARRVSMVSLRRQSMQQAGFAQEKGRVREAPTLPPWEVQILPMQLSLQVLPVQTQQAILAEQQVPIYVQRRE